MGKKQSENKFDADLFAPKSISVDGKLIPLNGGSVQVLTYDEYDYDNACMQYVCVVGSVRVVRSSAVQIEEVVEDITASLQSLGVSIK